MYCKYEISSKSDVRYPWLSRRKFISTLTSCVSDTHSPIFPTFSPSRPTVTPSRTMPGTTGLSGVVPAGVLTGENVIKLFQHCSDNGVALPAFNCTSSSTINAVLQVSRDYM